VGGPRLALDLERNGRRGETTAELSARSTAAYDALPQEGVIVVVSHGGPIAAVRTMLAGVPITDILNYRVGTGSITSLTDEFNTESPAVRMR
jgi:broad specificity phosphatase PhoE